MNNLDAATEYLEREMPDWLWEFTRITNPIHGVSPMGAGIGLTLRSPDGETRVFEKGTDMLPAAMRAVTRARARLAGNAGA